MELADRMAIPPGQLYHIERGALLHDIGKIGISDRILQKSGKLTAEEWAEVRKHPVIGYQMCADIEMLEPAAQIIRHHHERWDGMGYPDRLKAEAIPMGARIFAVADALDGITSDRPYRAARPLSVAREEIAGHSGKQFDPDVVRVFLAIPESRWMFIRAHAAR
jgi:HD-GYP domain-containing protein (c-di-GMP phosphodiesterase class II)